MKVHDISVTQRISRKLSTGNLWYARYAVVIAWLLFTSALAGWWYLFGVEQTRRVIALDRELTPAMTRHLKMLAYEGATLFFCIVTGGGALTYFMAREESQRRKLQAFFATFTHELKTPLASLRLQAESLKEDLAGSPHANLISRLTSDTDRLTLQLENSLFLANQDLRELLLERIELREFLKPYSSRWPELDIKIAGDCFVFADARALECIVTNVLHNSVTHGKASALDIRFEPVGKDGIALIFRDNGTGFRGDMRHLGKLFSRFYAGSGNGIGLYLVRRLAARMGGSAEFIPDDHFLVRVVLRGELL